jgi:hypothetical protein
VGWDPEWAVNPSELREHLSHDNAKPPAGLVVADSLAHELGLEALDEFQPGFRWAPWQLPQGWTPH